MYRMRRVYESSLQPVVSIEFFGKEVDRLVAESGRDVLSADRIVRLSDIIAGSINEVVASIGEYVPQAEAASILRSHLDRFGCAVQQYAEGNAGTFTEVQRRNLWDRGHRAVEHGDYLTKQMPKYQRMDVGTASWRSLYDSDDENGLQIDLPLL